MCGSYVRRSSQLQAACKFPVHISCFKISACNLHPYGIRARENADSIHKNLARTTFSKMRKTRKESNGTFGFYFPFIKKKLNLIYPYSRGIQAAYYRQAAHVEQRDDVTHIVSYSKASS